MILLCCYPLQQHRRRLILPPLPPGELCLGGHQLPGERLSEDGLPEGFGALFRGGNFGLNLVGEGEEGIDAADDLVLFGEGRERYFFAKKVWLCYERLINTSKICSQFFNEQRRV